MRKKILLTGPILTQSGYGVHARTVYRALASRPDLFDIFVNPVPWGNTSWVWEDNEERRSIDHAVAKYTIFKQRNLLSAIETTLLVTIPQEWKEYRLDGAYNIGVTAGIESSKASALWVHSANEFVDQIIMVSDFSKSVLENSVYQIQQENGVTNYMRVQTPIHSIGYPVKKYNKIKPIFELENDFNFLIVAQWGIRKNIEMTIKWFLDVFSEEEIGLVIKTNTAGNSILDFRKTKDRLLNLLAMFPNRKCKIYFLHGSMNNDEIHSLYNHPKIKALISLTHGEGFGLPMFEAAYCGLPVITHDWGGQTDFLYSTVKDKKGKQKKKALFCKVDYDLAYIQKEAVWEHVLEKDSQWAYPKEKSVKEKLFKVYKNYDIYKGMAKKLKKNVLKDFPEEKINEKFIKVIYNEKVPKIPDIKYVFVSDAFADQFSGGAEFSLQTLIDNCPDRYIKINSMEVDHNNISFYKDCEWIIGNFTEINFDLLEKIKDLGIKYSIVEFDYKFCKYRNIMRHELTEGTPCDCMENRHGRMVANAFENAKNVFFMSKEQMNICLQKMPGVDKSRCQVLSSIFDQSFFDKIKELREKYKNDKNDKWIISGAPMWVKGSDAAEEWCKENNKKYEKLYGVPYEQALEILAQSEGVCFTPAGHDTCPRFTIEAKLLGCELHMNEYVQHKDEDWFDTDNLEQVEEYLSTGPSRFWEAIGV